MIAVTLVIHCVQNQLQIDCRGQIPGVSLTKPVAGHYGNLRATRLLINKSLERAYFQISKGKPEALGEQAHGGAQHRELLV